jgi:small-conductance mechanosensitive channel/CRP-like cAMP-binding protein
VTLSIASLSTYLGATSSAPVAWVVGVLLLAAARMTSRNARAVRFPAALLMGSLGALLVQLALPDALGLSRPLALASLLFTLLAIGRSLFLLLIDAAFGRRLTTPMPRILRDILQAFFFLFALLVFLRAVGVELGSLLTTSALLTAVIGLALQDTIGNVISGLALQFQRVIEVGDWIQFNTERDLVGRVIEINWRATNIMTVDHVEVVIPNSILAKTPVRNFTRPTSVSRRSVEVACGHDVSPARVRQVLLNALHGAPSLLTEPAPQVVTHAFGESGITYLVRYYIDDFARHASIDSAVRERVWYALRRASIASPLTVRALHVETAGAASALAVDTQHARTVAALRSVDFLAALPDAVREELARGTRTELFAADEIILRQGETGSEFFILQRGEVSVLAGRVGGSVIEVAKLGPGAFFGEMSLMLGEPRRATIRAATESEVFVLDKTSLQPILAAHPELVERIGTVLAKRLEDLDAHLAEREKLAASRKTAPEQTEDFMKRVREFFAL